MWKKKEGEEKEEQEEEEDEEEEEEENILPRFLRASLTSKLSFTNFSQIS